MIAANNSAMRRLSSLATPFALALVLALGSVGFAASHQGGAGTDRYVICTGYGLVTITVDAQGNRVAEGVPCPDSMALSAAMPVSAPSVTFSRLAVARIVVQESRVLARAQTTDAWRDARAPPAPVFA
ncbi:MAG: hypothetical protein GVY34_08790 [Alphaproteobacteria bacterium]|jgi:hypothetical protein|nr:hypothetical protein [Alphaproteobacteria bacterium]